MKKNSEHSRELLDFLETRVMQYNTPSFVIDDPISIPHNFTLKEDVEIAGFLVSTISWGNRKMIVRNGQWMMEMMDQAPYDFVKNHEDRHLNQLNRFVHRTFNSEDFKYFVKALHKIYTEGQGLEAVFTAYQESDSLQPAIHCFHQLFFSLAHHSRTRKHLADPAKGSAAKRINMFLRWMIRKDNAGVDFGIWRNISPAKLSCPLDVHSGRVARKLGLLTRAMNDQQAVIELDTNLRLLDPTDPVKYDFALFGLGIYEGY